MPYTSPLLPHVLKSRGDGAFIFDLATGDTRYLWPLTLTAYQTSCDHPGDTSTEIASAMATRLALVDTPQLHNLTEETLNSLRKISLRESP